LDEFTGERVIPGQVDTDLWNEHFSRYAFALQFAAGKRVLDLGCGSGYGPAELARIAHSVAGVDISADAIEYARAHYAAENLSYSTGSCTRLPFPDGSFEFITAFEVIEHLTDWRDMLSETRRLLGAGGGFLVSTPNKLYYADQRREAGPNPFHEHEFEFEEFRDALREFFPRVEMLLQNRTEAFVYAPVAEGSSTDPLIRIESSGADPAAAHFFIALCGNNESEARPFAFVPATGNLLRERELHIARLKSELALKDQWLASMTGQRDQLQTQHTAVLEQLEERNRWAQSLESELESTRQRVVALQDEFARDQEAAREVASAYEAKVEELERDVNEKTAWALETERRLTGELESKGRELAEAVKLLDRAESTVEERTRWAQDLDARLTKANTQLGMIRSSRWVKLGRAAGVGPKVD
jgi:ubiquinone/menaquinone biosynthesis C-methylase UbiE